MYKHILVFLLTSVGGICHSQFYENFDNHDVNQWISWPPNHWEIDSSSTERSLHHNFNSNVSGYSNISYYLPMDFMNDATWSFKIKYGYYPSASNNWCIFLVSNTTGSFLIPGGNIKGYAIGLNMKNNNDLLSLYRFDGNDLEVILETTMNWENEVSTDSFVFIQVIRKTHGHWSLFFNKQGNGENTVQLGSVTDTTYNHSDFWGILYNYTSSQDQKLWIDDININGDLKKDIDPPNIKNILVLNDTCLEVTFSEPVNLSENNTNKNFSINDNTTDSIEILDIQKILIYYSKGFKQTNFLFIEEVSDYAGNVMKGAEKTFNYYKPGIYDIVFTEVMNKPEGDYLPYEYIEILNKSEFPISAQKWEICVDKKCRNINFHIKANQYMIICDEDKFLDVYNENVIISVNNLPALPNDEGILELKNENGNYICHLSYASNYHSSAYKEEGGWSMEIIDPDYPCLEKENWTSSSDHIGGSPGRKNSCLKRNPDMTPPNLIRTSYNENHDVQLIFSENMNPEDLLNLNFYKFDDLGSPNKITPEWPGYRKINLQFGDSLEEKMRYLIEVRQEMKDCAGNHIGTTSAPFEIPQFPDSNDIIINEVLFHSGILGTEFIEIYNPSDKVFNLNHILIAGYDNYSKTLKNIAKIKEDGYLLFPDEYVVLTNSKENLLNEYYVPEPENIFENRIPTLPDNEATIVLCDQNMKIINLIHYSESQHHPLLNSTRGVSLECINPGSSSIDPTNWHSASSLSGFATPGYQNSQYSLSENVEKIVNIEPKVFSPDNDGYNDLLQIQINLSVEGYIAYVLVFDALGRKIRTVANHMLLGTRNSLIWDGRDDSGNLRQIGKYIIFIRLFNISGETKEFKESCVIAGYLK